MRVLRLLSLAAAITVLLFACGGSDDEAAVLGDDVEPAPVAETDEPEPADEPAVRSEPAEEPEPPAEPEVTEPGPAEDPEPHRPTGFSGTVLPIVETSCARCHTGDGPGTPHLRMDTVGDLVENRDLVWSALETYEMPPWPASDLSVDFDDDFGLSAEDREVLMSWASTDPTVDVDEATPVVATHGVRRLQNVDVEVFGEGSYDGRQYQADEYRCFVFDPGFTADTWVTGFEFVPDQTEIVHHAIGYLIPAAQRGAADALDAAHPDQGGWPCFGGSRLGNDEIFLGWAPGQGPRVFPDGSGLRMAAGEFIVMQIHYHFEIDAPADRSVLWLDLVDDDVEELDEVEVVSFVAPAEIPCAADESGPLCDRGAAIANAIDAYGEEGVRADFALSICGAEVADFAEMTDGVARASCDLPARVGGTLVSVLGHEHELGASFRMTLRPDTPDELVLLDIPDWRFDWQLNYRPVDEIRVDPFDMVRIECSWDRSLRDPDLEPAYVVWADGTNDEMCFATIAVMTDA